MTDGKALALSIIALMLILLTSLMLDYWKLYKPPRKKKKRFLEEIDK